MRPLEAKLTAASGSSAAAHLAGRLADIASLEGRIAEVARSVAGAIAFSTSLGMEDQAILHAIAQTGAAIDIFTLDTGRHYPETLDTLAQSERRYGLRIRVLAPESEDLEQLVGRDGVLGFRLSVEARQACCEVRKVRPLRRGLNGAAAWITGLRREQSRGRSLIPFADWDEENGLIKLNPLADWTARQLEAYIAANDVPINPLLARGFPSIGCQPCTRAVHPGEDIRAGRWWWESQDGKECGLHSRPGASAGAPATIAPPVDERLHGVTS